MNEDAYCKEVLDGSFLKMVFERIIQPNVCWANTEILGPKSHVTGLHEPGRVDPNQSKYILVL